MKIRSIEKKDFNEMLNLCQMPEISSLPDCSYPKSQEELQSFIEGSAQNLSEKHFAIVNADDEFKGLVCLRHIDSKENRSSLSIIVNPNVWSKGYAWFGMVEVLKYAFNTLALEQVYWCVKKDNPRAIRFFRKHGFNSLDKDIPKNIVEQWNNNQDLIWFAVLKNDDYENIALSRKTIADCNIIKIKTVPTIEAGALSFFEGTKDIPFDIKRVYFISQVPEGARRGFHAHKNLKQLLFCPYGKIQLVLDNGENGGNREEITLNDPSIGIVIEKPVWREMLWLEKNSVLVVAASDFYTEDDYLRNYDDFLKYIDSVGH
ncbi:GNAT family N-acetyltransferase [Succinivibrio dextrinosolvens]|uniref:GNAT family N-acetyltransferase n=1 Tax=Succinivibrio dextrinosolvens TaxID=83771 RepID=UPI00247A81C5|nr:GNAT family N-acetyltransferase [Succinivibrio dextrinosolvens]